MIRATTLILVGLSANSAWADCRLGEEVFLTCDIRDSAKVLSVCHDDEVASYRFGLRGEVPELEISSAISDVLLVPWPGFGRTIWEEIHFKNEGHNYMVYAAVHREYPEDENADIIVHVEGGVEVSKDDEMVVALSCKTGSVDFPWGTGIYDAKTELGLCFDKHETAWLPCTEN